MPELALAVAIGFAVIVAVGAITRIVRRPRRVWLWVVALVVALAALGCALAAWLVPSSVDTDGTVQEQFWLLPVSYLLTGLAVTIALVAVFVARGPRQSAPAP
jgi:hypothetical protein